MDQFLDLKYIQDSTENYDEYLILLGVSFLMRKMAAALKLTHWLSKNGDGTYDMHTASKVVNGKCTFVPGEEFEESKLDGTKCRSTITFEGNTMLHVQVDKQGRVHRHHHEFSQDKLIVTTTADGLEKPTKKVFIAIK